MEDSTMCAYIQEWKGGEENYMAQTLRDFLPGVRYNGLRRVVVSDTDTTHTLDKANSGAIFIATASSGTQTYTLPAVANDGAFFTFICGNAGGEILVTPQSGEAIKIVTFAAVGVDADTAIVAPTAGTGVKNTAATNAVTDNLTIVSDGTQWLGIGITGGIWASQ